MSVGWLKVRRTDYENVWETKKYVTCVIYYFWVSGLLILACLFYAKDHQIIGTPHWATILDRIKNEKWSSKPTPLPSPPPHQIMDETAQKRNTPFLNAKQSDPWGQNTPICHDIRRVKTTILPVNKILMRFSTWNSCHLPRQFVIKQLYALFRAFCWETFANKWHFASCNSYTLRKLSRSKAHWKVIAF